MSYPSEAVQAVGLQGVGRALVVGFAASGVAATRLLVAHGIEVRLVDRREDAPADVLSLHERVEVVPATDGLEWLADVDLVVPSPGVPEHAPLVREAVRRGVPVWSEPELAWRVRPRRMLAVTGTNGKTSTTELLAAMAAAGGAASVACGNIGLPLSEAVLSAPDDALLVAELSSFQLRFAGSLRPEVGVLLNLAPDHLDWHGDERAYHAAKARLWEAQGPEDWAVANADDPTTLQLREGVAARIADFSGTREVEVGVGVADGKLVVAAPDEASRQDLVDLEPLGLPPHRVANAAAAATAALLAGVPLEAIASAVRHYQPGRHRFETVVTSPSGVRFVDDSKATNAHAARAALQATGPFVWIAGGLAKGVPLDTLVDDLGQVHAAVLIGEAADELERVCTAAGVPTRRAPSIEDAVRAAAELARAGDTVLLSPACSSFDQFRDYAERGDRFAAAARAVVAGQSRR